jgi:hypothetical protein
MSLFFLNFFQNVFLCCPFVFWIWLLLPIYKRIYVDTYNESLSDDCKNRILTVLTKIYKNSYQLKKFDATYQETCIIVTSDGILIDEERIKSLSNTALEMALHYEMSLYEKKIYIIQLGLLIISLLISSAFIFYIGTIHGLAYSIPPYSKLMSVFIFNGIALVIQLIGITLGIEYINFEQKKRIVRSLVSDQSKEFCKEGLKEYFSYHKSYFDQIGNIKYDIDKLFIFVDSL